MTTLIDRLKNPELHYPGNFDTPARANAVLMSLCQEAADALADIKQDLTPEHEPVAWQWKATMNFLKKPPENAEPGVWRPVYTTPTSAQRQWVGLEKSDMPDGEDPMFDHPYFINGMVYAAKKLIEKNT